MVDFPERVLLNPRAFACQQNNCNEETGIKREARWTGESC